MIPQNLSTGGNPVRIFPDERQVGGYFSSRQLLCTKSVPDLRLLVHPAKRLQSSYNNAIHFRVTLFGTLALLGKDVAICEASGLRQLLLRFICG